MTMTHSDARLLTAREGRWFALPVGTAFGIVAFVLAWRGLVFPSALIGLIGGSFILLGIAVPTRLGPMLRAWMRFALALSRITNPILLTVLFLVVITPVGLIARLVGYRPLVNSENGGSFLVDRTGSPRSDLSRPY